MKVLIAGMSDDVVDISGDISKEIDAGGRMPKLYIYSDGILQFIVKVKFHGGWNITPELDDKTYDEDKEYKSKFWDIKLQMQGQTIDTRRSMVLNIDSGEDVIEITTRRRKGD